MTINRTPSDMLALTAAAAGAAVGYAGFWWLAGQGFYGLILPGGLTGIFAGLVVHRSRSVAAAAGLAGLALGAITEFRYAPFLADGSLGYFIGHLADLRPITLITIVAGGVIAFWGPFRSRVRPSRAAGRPS